MHLLYECILNSSTGSNNFLFKYKFILNDYNLFENIVNGEEQIFIAEQQIWWCFEKIIILYTLIEVFYLFSTVFIFLSKVVSIIFLSLVDMLFNNLWKMQRVIVMNFYFVSYKLDISERRICVLCACVCCVCMHTHFLCVCVSACVCTWKKRLQYWS